MTTVSLPKKPRFQRMNEADHRAKMKSLSEKIINPTSPWLVDYLYDQTFEFISADGISQIYPTRLERSDSLDKINKACERLLDELPKVGLSGFLEVGSGSDCDNTTLIDELRRLRYQTQLAIRSPLLVGENGKLLRGAGKPLLPNTLPPRHICAVIISEVFDFLYDDKKIGKPKKVQICAAAQEYWSSIFTPNGWGTVKEEGWKDIFKPLNEPRFQSLRAEMRRRLECAASIHHVSTEEKELQNAD